MLFLENKLIEFMNIKDLNNSLRTYKKMFKKATENCSKSTSCLRHTKDFLINLNAVISRNYYCKPICKKILYDMRLQFIQKIEIAPTIESLYLIGENLIESYIKNIDVSTIATKNPNINSALEYIQNNLDKNLTLDEVANNIFISSTYLSHLFSKCLDMTFSQYIISARIEKSKNLLLNTDASIMDIALECGFNSQSYFSNVFKKIEDITPKDYRIQYKKRF